MLIRQLTLRFALAVTALFGQLTPSVAVPLVIAFRPAAPAVSGGCVGASCSCTIVEKATRGCCCSKSEAAGEPRSCCEKPAKPKANPWRSGEVAVPTEPTAKLVPGGSCSCDRAKAVAASEPATQAVPEVPLRQFESPVGELVPAPAGIPSSLAHPPQPPPPRV